MTGRGKKLVGRLRQAAGILAGSASALAACSGAHEPARVPVSGGAARSTVAPTANVPALLGKSIDGLRRDLGPAALPKDFVDPLLALADSAQLPDSIKAFRTGGLTIVASYDARTRQVRDLLLLGRHEDSLMGRASLRSNAAEYLVLPVFCVGSPNRLLGLRVVAIN